jgi:hypothetical protein
VALLVRLESLARQVLIAQFLAHLALLVQLEPELQGLLVLQVHLDHQAQPELAQLALPDLQVLQGQLGLE